MKILLLLPVLLAPQEAADVAAVRERIVADALAFPVTRPKDLAAEAGKNLEGLRPDGSWEDVDYDDKSQGRWKAVHHLYRLWVMAAAYRTPDSKLHNDPGLKRAMLSGLDYWLKNDFRNPNWWWNEIWVPRMLGTVLLLMEEVVSPDQKAGGIDICRRAAWERWTGQNLIWGVYDQIIRGCLENSPAIVKEGFDRAYEEIRVAPAGLEGLQADFSFHQHGSTLYSGGYGFAFTADCAFLVGIARGTAFACPKEKLDLLTGYILDHQQWTVIGTMFDPGVIGREIAREGKSAVHMIKPLDQMAQIPGPRREEFAAFADRVRGKAPILGAPVGNRHFWNSDFMVHRRPGWHASARMFSTRTLSTDGVINNEGRKSHHLSDGAFFLIRTTKEYEKIYPVWNWQLIPGTTVEQREEILPRNQVQLRGTTSFVGGVSDGTHGMAAMRLARGELTARKAWFFFDREIVCLGAGINCPTDRPVRTSINQCFLNGAVRVAGRNTPMERGQHLVTGPEWVLHDGVRYVFPGGADVVLRLDPQTGNWAEIGSGPPDQLSYDVFSLWIEHGARVSDGSYRYIIVPAGGEAGKGVEIIRNTPELQAVRHSGLQVALAAFHEPGTIGPITVDQPCLVLYNGKEGRVAVSNPENKPLTVNVKVGETSLRFDLPDGVHAGQSVVKRLP